MTTVSRCCERNISWLTELPDEVLGIIVRQLPHVALKHLSLVSQRLNRLVRPSLFQRLNLSKHRLSELKILYRTLFTHEGGARGPLAGVRLGNLTITLDEDIRLYPDAGETLSVLQKILSRLSSVTTCTFEISLIAKDAMYFQEHLVAALDLVLSVPSTRSARFQVSIEAYESGFAAHQKELLVTSKLEQILALFAQDSISSLRVTGVSMIEIGRAHV